HKRFGDRSARLLIAPELVGDVCHPSAARLGSPYPVDALVTGPARGVAERRFLFCVPGAFYPPLWDLVEALLPGLVPLLVQEGLREGDERAGVAFSVGQVGRAVGVALEDEEVLAVDDPTEAEFAEPAQLLVGCCS